MNQCVFKCHFCDWQTKQTVDWSSAHFNTLLAHSQFIPISNFFSDKSFRSVKIHLVIWYPHTFQTSSQFVPICSQFLLIIILCSSQYDQYVKLQVSPQTSIPSVEKPVRQIKTNSWRSMCLKMFKNLDQNKIKVCSLEAYLGIEQCAMCILHHQDAFAIRYRNILNSILGIISLKIIN